MTTATRQSATRQFWVYVGAAAVLVYSLAPFLWIMIASITPEVSKDYGTLSGRRVTYFPSHPTFDNYVDLFVNNPFALYFRNSTIIATGNMLLTLLVASLGAYAFVRFRFAGRSSLLIAMLVMEAGFGVYGLVAAPVYYAYLKQELVSEKLI